MHFFNAIENLGSSVTRVVCLANINPRDKCLYHLALELKHPRRMEPLGTIAHPLALVLQFTLCFGLLKTRGSKPQLSA